MDGAHCSYPAKLSKRRNSRVTQHRPARPAKPSIRLDSQILEDWQQAVLKHARIKGLRRDMPPHDKIKAILRQELKHIRQLWEAFTLNRAELPRYLLDPKKQMVAYLLGFHLPNVARITGLLERAHTRGLLPRLLRTASHMRVHDWGCGSGAVTQSWRHYLKSQDLTPANLEWLITDQHGAFLDVTRTLLPEPSPEFQLKSRRGRLENLLSTQPEPDSDETVLNVYLLGYVWNELAPNPKAQRRVLEALSQANRGNSLIILAEPANQNPSREAMSLRDQLTDDGWTALYPCPTSSSCPMLERSRDWCYSEFYWQRPSLMKILDDKLDIRREQLSGSVYLFASPSLLQQAESKLEPGEPVVVGRPQQKSAKGKTSYQAGDYLLCRGDRLDRQPIGKGPRVLRGLPLSSN
jgi:hypothetical protein